MKSFVPGRSQAPTLITILVMVFLGAAYFFIYIPSNETNVQEQRFRSLRNIDQNIHAKIDNSISMLDLLIKAYGDKSSDTTNIRDYIYNYPKENFTLSIPVKLSKKLVVDTDSLEFYRIEVNNSTGNLSLHVQEPVINSQDSSWYQMAIHFKISQFIRSLLPDNVFDEYIIFSGGKPVYESFPAGISSIADTLLHVKKGVSGSVVRNYNISGTDYKLFLQPVDFGSKEWVIGGLLTEKRYNKEKDQLPARIVLFLVTIVLIIILFFPWVKLYQMGSKDRLTLTDAVQTIVISMLLMSLLFFMFFKYNTPFKEDNSLSEKIFLADTIVNAFKKEVDTAYVKLDLLDQLAEKTGYDIVSFGKKTMVSKSEKKIDIAEQINDLVKDFPVKQVFWLNEKGVEKQNWNSESRSGPHGYFENRAYFENIKNGNYFLQADFPTRPYYLDQLVSRTTGAFTTVISIPSQHQAILNDSGKYVACMSFSVKSLQQVVMPPGFQFAITNNSGKVLYHSDSTRNLNESLLNEFSEGNQLKSILEAGSAGHFTTSYFSNNYYVYTRPVSGLPYYITILEDQSFKETKDMEVYSFTISCMLFFFAFMIVQMMINFFISSKRSFFKKQVFSTSWTGPKKSLHHAYNLAIAAHILLIILLLVFFQFSSFLLFVYLLLFSVSFQSLFLNSVFSKAYKKVDIVKYRYKKKVMLWLVICIVIVDLFALVMLKGIHILQMLLFEFIAFAIGVILLAYGDKILKRIRGTLSQNIRGRWKYLYSYTSMIFTKLVVSSGIPVMFFYVTAYNYEQAIDNRYRQLQFAKNVIKKLPSSQLDSIGNGVNYRSGVYVDNTIVRQASIVGELQVKNNSDNYNKEDLLAIEILNLFRLKINDNAVNNDNLYAEPVVDASFYYNHLFGQIWGNSNGTITAVRAKMPGKYLQVTSVDSKYKFPGISLKYPLRGIFYWVLLVGGLIFFYCILLNIIRKLLALNVPDLTKWSGLDNKILASPELNNLLFVIGLPGSGKLKRILKEIKTEKKTDENGKPTEEPLYIYNENDHGADNVFVADLMNIPDSVEDHAAEAAWKFYSKKIFSSKNKLVIINHFEYNIQDAFTTRIKLNLLENIMVQNSFSVIILSTIHPVAFLDSAFDNAARLKQPAMPGQDLERWHVLLGHYRIVVFPLEGSDFKNKKAIDKVIDEMVGETEKRDVGKRTLAEAVYVETRRTHFLNKMKQEAYNTANAIGSGMSTSRKADELALKLQTTSHYFYMYIWQSLTKEEKFLLYDHAEDNLVNSFDDYNLNMLICKGILVSTDGSLKIFNNGFRNFILTAIGNTEAMKIKNQIKDNGNWSKLKNPMLIIILAILAFLIASQQEAYSKLIAYAAALGTAVPTIMRIFSFFDGTKEKASA